MTTVTGGSTAAKALDTGPSAGPEIITVPTHTVEIVCDSGEGAQKAGQIFGTVSAKMGNGVWTVEIIPAEIQPPPRQPQSASGNRIRVGTDTVTNWGDSADLVVAFNEQALLARHRLEALHDDSILLIESMWENHEDESIRKQWAAAMEELQVGNRRIVRVPMEEQCLTLVDNARRGKNMFVLGMLACIYQRDCQIIKDLVAYQFRKKSEAVVKANYDLFDLGYKWADENLDFRVEVPIKKPDRPMVVMNGNQAVALGAIASGMELCAMYPITPATSVSHYLSEIFEKFGGIVHQAEDEIAAVGVCVGASFAGKVAFTVTSGPGMSLKQEILGLAVMIETPMVLVNVQRGGPSTGLPTKVEQADLLPAIFGQHGDSPHVVLAPATIEECFHCMITARRIAETFRMPVMVLTDANLATGVQPFPRPNCDPEWQAKPVDFSAIPEGLRPYDWDHDTGLARRFIPGQPGGMHVTTGLSHDEASKVAYGPEEHQLACTMRSRKLAVFEQTLKPPTVRGEDSGDLLVVAWGSTLGAIEEAVERARAEGRAVSSLHLRFLSPLEPGLKDIFSRFKAVMTVEINYSDIIGDPYITEENRRRGQLCLLLRASTLVDVDCWTRVIGQPLRPANIYKAIISKLTKGRPS